MLDWATQVDQKHTYGNISSKLAKAMLVLVLVLIYTLSLSCSIVLSSSWFALTLEAKMIKSLMEKSFTFESVYVHVKNKNKFLSVWCLVDTFDLILGFLKLD